MAVAGLAVHGATWLFFAVDRSWVAPTVLTPADPRVIAFRNCRYVDAAARREALILERADVEIRVREAKRTLEVERAFQAASSAAKSPSSPEPAKPEIEPANPEVGGVALLRATPTSSYDALKTAVEYARSVVAAQKASEESRVATGALAMLEQVVEKQERVMEAMQRSPFYGITGGRSFAFVPHANARNVIEGSPVFACRLGFTWCKSVGRVGAAAEGEVVERHPWLSQDVRGTLVRVHLDDEASAEGAVLHVGRGPL